MNPILLDFPDSFETERLLIRCPRPGDGEEVNAAIRETVEDLKPWMEWVQTVPTVEQSEEWCRRTRAAFMERTNLPFQLYLKGTETYVGGSGIHRMDWEVPRFEIGYWCRKRFQGQGYITEAVRGITRFAFDTLGANRVEIRCDVRNKKSQDVAGRCGYTLEALLRNNGRRVDGTLEDVRVYSMIPEDYRRLDWSHAYQPGGAP